MARILVIDDDDPVRTTLRTMLQHFGHTVTEARHGKEGLALFRDAHADLVITDIVMPDRDGLEVLRELRKAHPSVKVIAMSGGGLGNKAQYLQTATRMGAAAVLAKPFDVAMVMAAVNALLAGGASD
jgi:DNA-binding response OmpR family regulator